MNTDILLQPTSAVVKCDENESGSHLYFIIIAAMTWASAYNGTECGTHFLVQETESERERVETLY